MRLITPEHKKPHRTLLLLSALGGPGHRLGGADGEQERKERPLTSAFKISSVKAGTERRGLHRPKEKSYNWSSEDIE